MPKNCSSHVKVQLSTLVPVPPSASLPVPVDSFELSSNLTTRSSHERWGGIRGRIFGYRNNRQQLPVATVSSTASISVGAMPSNENGTAVIATTRPFSAAQRRAINRARAAVSRGRVDSDPASVAPSMVVDETPGPLLLSSHTKAGQLPGRAHRLPSIFYDPSEIRVEMSELNSGSSAGKGSGQDEVKGGPPSAGRFSSVVRTAMLVRGFMNMGDKDERQVTEADLHDACVFEAPRANLIPATMTSPPPLLSEPSRGTLASSLVAAEEGHITSCGLTKAIVRSGWMFFVEAFTLIRSNSWLTFVWSFIVAAAVTYNIHAFVIFIFDDIYHNLFWHWVVANAVCDVIYVIDFWFQSHTVYLLEGLEVRAPDKLRWHYRQSTGFILDLLALVPLDLLLFVWPVMSLFRVNRLLKFYRILDFIGVSEMKMSYRMLNVSKVFWLVSACWVLFHWNACIYYYFSVSQQTTNPKQDDFIFNYVKIFDPYWSYCPIVDYDFDKCLFNESGRNISDRMSYAPEMTAYMLNKTRDIEYSTRLVRFNNFSKEYAMSIYWSSMTITNRGQQPWPANSWQNALEIVDTLIGLVVFATIVGSVGNVVANFNKERAGYNDILDGVKFFMNYRGLNSAIQRRVIHLLKYLYDEKKWASDADILECLPERTVGRLNVQLHMADLSKTRLFEGSDPIFIYEVVNRLKRRMYSPSDFVCQVDDRAQSMYMVKKGTLVVKRAYEPDMEEIMTAGSTYGELSIMHLRGISEEKRTSELQCLGYVELYELERSDFSQVMRDYAEERDRILLHAKKMYRDGIGLPTDPDQEPVHGNKLPLEELTEAGLIAMFSFEEKEKVARDKLALMQAELDATIERFNAHTAECKQKLTIMEDIYRRNSRRIRREFSLGD